MATPSRAQPKIVFGPFDVDTATKELRKHGVRIKLQKQPFQILAALLERPGDVITREELRQKLWGGDTFVDFEHGLNAAINKLRQALADSPENPRYIETIPGIGYRLIAPVETLAEAPPPMPPVSARPGRNPYRVTLPAAMLILGLVCGWLLRPSNTPTSAARLVQFTVPLPEGFSSELAGTRQDLAISPDGSHLAFVVSDADKSQLWVRELASLRSYPVAPDRNVRGLVWASDSRSLYFDERTTIRQIGLDESAARTICQLPLGAPWMGLLRSGNDLILYTRAGSFRVPASGGTPTRLDNLAYQWTQALPGSFLLNVQYDRQIGRYRAWAVNLKNEQDKRPLVEADSRVSYAPLAPGAPKGHLLYVRAGTLMAHPFDAGALRLAGDPVAIAEKVVSFAPTGAAAFSASENGVLVYRTVENPSRLKWLDRAGRELEAVGKPGTFMTPYRLSPDGTKLAATVYDVEKGGMDVWIYDMVEGTERKLTVGPATEALPVWSPDGTRIAYGRAAGATPKLYGRPISESGKDEPLTQAHFQLPTDWSRDGRFILYQTTGGAGEPGADIVAVDLRNDGRLVPLLHSASQELEGSLSPDGRLLAFLSDETGTPELYLQAFESDPLPHVTGDKRQVSKGGGSVVRWRADGKEIYYIGSDSWITAVTVRRDAPLELGVAQKLFHLDLPPRNLTAAGPGLGFDVSRDGRRFLIPDTSVSRDPYFVVIENWPELLAR